MTTLIVDPSANRQRQLRALLISQGYRGDELLGAPDAIAASKSTKGQRVDVIFVWHEPGRSSRSVLAGMGDALSSAAKLILYGAAPTEDDVREAVTAGAAGYVSYPFSFEGIEGIMKLVQQKRD